MQGQRHINGGAGCWPPMSRREGRDWSMLFPKGPVRQPQQYRVLRTGCPQDQMTPVTPGPDSFPEPPHSECLLFPALLPPHPTVVRDPLQAADTICFCVASGGGHGCRLVLCQLDTARVIWEERPQLRNCLQRISLWESFWGFMNDD